MLIFIISGLLLDTRLATSDLGWQVAPNSGVSYKKNISKKIFFFENPFFSKLFFF